MAKKDSIAKAEATSATTLPQDAGATLQWDGSNGVYRDVGSHTFSAQVQPSFFQAKGPPATEPGASPYWTTGEIGLVPGLSPQAIEWEQAAALATFSLAPVLLADTVHAVLAGASGELVGSPGPSRRSPSSRLCAPCCLSILSTRRSRPSA